MPRPTVDTRWYHRVPGLLKSYRRTCVFMGGCNMARIRSNITLANSDYISEKIHELI